MFYDKKYITKDCLEYCNIQIQSITNNLLTSDLIILAIGLIFFFIYYLIDIGFINFEDTNINQKSIDKITSGSFQMGFLIILGFIIYKMFF